MPTIAAPVDESGNITVPMEGGVVIPLREQTSDGTATEIDISAIPMRFLVKGRLNKTVGTDQNNPLGKLLVITEAEADQLSAKGHSFQLLDETNPLLPVVLWSGKIKRGL